MSARGKLTIVGNVAEVTNFKASNFTEDIQIDLNCKFRKIVQLLININWKLHSNIFHNRLIKSFQTRTKQPLKMLLKWPTLKRLTGDIQIDLNCNFWKILQPLINRHSKFRNIFHNRSIKSFQTRTKQPLKILLKWPTLKRLISLKTFNLTRNEYFEW